MLFTEHALNSRFSPEWLSVRWGCFSDFIDEETETQEDTYMAATAQAPEDGFPLLSKQRRPP